MKRLIIPAAVLIVIAAAWFIQDKLEHKQIRGKSIENFLEIDREQINRIDIGNAGDILTFRLDNFKWYVTVDSVHRRADSMAVNNMINVASDLKAGNVISQNPERQKDFMVDELSGTFVRFYRDDRLLSDVVVGKVANDYSHTYIRKPESDEVYLAEGLITYAFKRNVTQWLDKTLYSFGADKITAIEIDADKKAWKLWRGDDGWYVGPRPYRDSSLADSMQAAVYVGSMQTLVAGDFVNAADSGMIDFDHPSLNLKIYLADGAVISLTFAALNEGTSRVFCRTPEYDDTFVIYRSKFDNIKKDLSEF